MRWTSVHVVDRDAASLDDARRLGPENSDASCDDVTTLGDNTLAVVERCCQFPDPDPERWHVLSVDATTGTVNGEVFGQDRTEATPVDARDDAAGLIAVRRGGPDGGTLLRWDGSGEPRSITDGVIVAAW